MTRYWLFLFLWFSFIGLLHAQGAAGNGLEVENPGTLEYLVEELSPDALKRGLTGALLRERVEARLRGANIRPRPSTLGAGPRLYVFVNVTGMVFSVRLEMQRPVTYSVAGRTHRSEAATWQTGGVGQSPTADYIIAALDGALDRFIKEYRAANAR